MHRLQIGKAMVELEKVPDALSVMRAEVDRVLLKSRWGDMRMRQMSHDQSTVVMADADARDPAMAALRGEGYTVHHVYRLTEDPSCEVVVGDEIHILPLPQTSDAELSDLLGANGLVRVRSLPGGVLSARVTATAGRNPIKLVEELQDRGLFAVAEPDMVIPNLKFAPVRYGEQWHLHGCGASSRDHIGVGSAWNLTRGSDKVVVAIVDDGYDLANADLVDGIVAPSDFTQAVPSVAGLEPSDAMPWAVAESNDFHGTPCAGLAIARGTAQVTGVAPECSWMPVRFPIGSSRIGTIIAMFQYISRHADVASCSWGLRPSGYTLFPQAGRLALEELIRTGGRRGKGLVVCFAAGNDNLPCALPADENANGFEYYDAMAGRVLGRFFAGREIIGGWPTVNGVVTVAASNATARKSRYSNWGREITVCAPSDDWLPHSPKTKIELGMPSLCTTDNATSGLSIDTLGGHEPNGPNGSTSQMGGTSGATPLVAGVAALVLSANPDLTALEVRDILATTAAKSDLLAEVDPATEVNLAGFDGRFDTAGHSLWFGAGRIDAGAAVQLALSLSAPTTQPE